MESIIFLLLFEPDTLKKALLQTLRGEWMVRREKCCLSTQRCRTNSWPPTSLYAVVGVQLPGRLVRPGSDTFRVIGTPLPSKLHRGLTRILAIPKTSLSAACIMWACFQQPSTRAPCLPLSLISPLLIPSILGDNCESRSCRTALCHLSNLE